LKQEFLPENNCQSCHNSERWSAISFNHDKTKFQLLGKHLKAACSNCHYDKKVSEKKNIIFSSLTADCETCHTDNHFGQFRINDKSDCVRCHTFENWKPEKFDHNKTKFKLEGAHLKAECSKCHKVNVKNEKPFVIYKIEDFRCVVCHS
jgi:nitrate/TMAO reductase-like tetraheme cytochrome c subunit